MVDNKQGVGCPLIKTRNLLGTTLKNFLVETWEQKHKVFSFQSFTEKEEELHSGDRP